MRSAARTAAVMAPALVVVAVAWLRFEQPLAHLGRSVVLVVLALAVAAPSRRAIRLAAAVAALFVAARIAFGVDLVPWRGTSGYSALWTTFHSGFSNFYATHLPFDPSAHVAMSELVLAAIFGFSVAAALLAAERKPVAAAAAVLVGAGWPATLLGPSQALAMGAAILAVALLVLAGLGSRRLPALAVPTVAIVAAGAIAVGSATASRHPIVHWQSWNLAQESRSVGVDFVWNARYGGLDWPTHPTVVLDVQSAQSPTYLRATVLDDFIGDRWEVGLPRTADFLEPPAALRPRNQTRQLITIEGLANRELVGGSIPVRVIAGGAELKQFVRGFVSLDEGLPRGFRYTVWSYSPHASAAQLRRSPPDYPAALTRGDFFDVGRGVSMPAFGVEDRFNTVQTLIGVTPSLGQYLPLARVAEQVAGRARTPYDAVVGLEKWFLDTGKFRYSNHPPVIAPPLVSFVTQTRTGYCQYFAGAMALMLRYLGIPARVAVGFAGGTYSAKNHAWLVTDRDSHAWVEVWFKGYGWITFDPTPPAAGAAQRQAIAGAGAAYAGSRPPAFPGAHNSAQSGGSSTVADKLTGQNGLGGAHTQAAPEVPVEHGGGGLGRRGLSVLLLLLAVVVALGAIVATKAGFRRRRRARRDPRAVATACREELAAFLVDQRVDVPRSATLRELGELVRQQFGSRPEEFVLAATAARFAPDDEAAAAAFTARRELRVLLGSARRGLTPWERLRGLLSLRSLGRSAAAVDASASLESVSVGS